MPWARSSGRRQQRPIRADQGRQHRLPPGAVGAMLVRQGGKCLICAGPIDERTAVIDHDHVLAERDGHDVAHGCPRCVRGLLDAKCNALLGFAHDDPEVLRRAAQYIALAREAHR